MTNPLLRWSFRLGGGGDKKVTRMDAAVTTTTKPVGGVAVPHAAAARLPIAPASSASESAAVGESKRKADSSYVFLRIKRRRNEEPVECLVVQSEPGATKEVTKETATSADNGDGDRKRKKSSAAAPASSKDLLNVFTKLSTKEKRYVYLIQPTRCAPLCSGV